MHLVSRCSTVSAMKGADYKKELQIALQAARDAGQCARRLRGNVAITKQPDKKTFLDVTTEADLEAEQRILKRITRAFPNDEIVSEETRATIPSKKGRIWIIDPLDGTTNFCKGLPMYAVAIAFSDKGKVQVAAVYLPEERAMFSAMRGSGVYRNGKRLSLFGATDSLEESLVCVGFPHLRAEAHARDAFAIYERLWLRSSDLRRTASAVYDGTLLASGVAGAYITPDIKPWDIAATSLFVDEQGGVMSDLSGKPIDLFRHDGSRFSTSAVFAKNRKIYTKLMSALTI